MPVMQLKNVVLPAPFGPMMLTMRSRSTRTSMPSRAFRPPKCLVRFFCLKKKHKIYQHLATEGTEVTENFKDFYTS